MVETPAVKRVAVVLFDGFTVLDVYGPAPRERPEPDAIACTGRFLAPKSRHIVPAAKPGIGLSGRAV